MIDELHLFMMHIKPTLEAISIVFSMWCIIMVAIYTITRGKNVHTK